MNSADITSAQPAPDGSFVELRPLHLPTEELPTLPSSSLLRTPMFWAAIVLATLMGALTAVPVGVWRQPTNDASYSGMDPNLIVINPKGYPLPEDGVIVIAKDSLELTAPPASEPSFHLATTPRSKLTAVMDVRILRADRGTIPFRIGIWSPRTSSGVFLQFGGPPNQNMSTEAISGGGAAQSLVGGTVVKSSVVGTYGLGLTYHVVVLLDKNAGQITFRVAGERLPILGQVLTLVGGPSNPGYGDFTSSPISVAAGVEYQFGAIAKLSSGTDAFKIALLWSDSKGRTLGVANDWQSVQLLSGWTRQQYTGKAPAGAVLARMLLGSGNGTVILFADPFVTTSAARDPNLLQNPTWSQGGSAWQFPRGASPPKLSQPNPAIPDTVFSANDLPELFKSLRLSLTGSAIATDGTSRAQISRFSLTLPHETYLVTKVDDPRSNLLILGLVVLGVLLAGLAIAGRGMRAMRELGYSLSRRVSLGEIGLIGGAVLVGYLLPNALLFGLASHPFDMGAEHLWAYISSKYGLSELYYLANSVSPAQAWGGAPYQEAVFPYGAAISYAFLAAGAAVNAAGSNGAVVGGSELTFAIKAINVLCGLGDAVLIFLILGKLGANRPWQFVGAGLFLFNPSVWFSMSVWGQTHVMSLLPLLLSIWLAETDHPIGAWVSLALAALTRPQMLIPSLLLSAVLVRRFGFVRSLWGGAWAIVAAFLVVAPLSIQISPTLPLDSARAIIATQEGGANEGILTVLSNDAYSVWPLVSGVVEGLHGHDRSTLPSDHVVIAGLSYQRLGQYITAPLLVLIALVLLLLPRSRRTPGHYLPFLAFGMTLFLMLMTGLAPTHFILALPLILLCLTWIPKPIYICLAVFWTSTTLISMYGSLGFAIDPVSALAPTFARLDITHFFMTASRDDRVITGAITANLVVMLLCLGTAVAAAIVGAKSVKTQGLVNRAM